MTNILSTSFLHVAIKLLFGKLNREICTYLMVRHKIDGATYQSRYVDSTRRQLFCGPYTGCEIIDEHIVSRITTQIIYLFYLRRRFHFECASKIYFYVRRRFVLVHKQCRLHEIIFLFSEYVHTIFFSQSERMFRKSFFKRRLCRRCPKAVPICG